MDKKIRIGSRSSRLAVIQTEQLINYIKQQYPQTETELVTMETTGDKRLDVTLDKIGGKGLFVKELDRALSDGQIDLSVHSLKDMPMEESEDLPIIRYSNREDPRDVLVLPVGQTQWDGKGIIGCSSFRRRIQAEKLFPEAEFRSIRGNVPTRLEKLDRGEYDALILAAAGLKRLGLTERICRYFSADEILPAAGQGMLAVQGRAGENYEFLQGFGSEEDRLIAKAERAFVRFLDGGCTSPVAAYGEMQGEDLFLRGLYYEPQDHAYIIGGKTGNRDNPEAAGIALAKELKETYERQKDLFALQDLGYRDFHARLMPTVDKEKVIGIRTPNLRKFAKEFGKKPEAENFLGQLPHQYYEENNVHGFLISGMKDYDRCIEELYRFLPYVDNWATCDLMSPKIFKKHLPELLEHIKVWIASEHTYMVRFGIGMLMSFYLDEAFEPEYLQMAASVKSEEYYINMMIAWYFATALAKQYDAARIYLEEKRLEKWTHNKTIQKAVESYRITSEQKAYLKTLKIK